jgi:hypothetical protein
MIRARQMMESTSPSEARGVSRRMALKALGSAAGTIAFLPWLSSDGLAAFARIQESGAAPAPSTLAPAQFATLERLVDAIIPADERSPGAKEAHVASYIDLLLSEADDAIALQWMGGLAALDAAAVARFGRPFVEIDDPQLDAILAEISANEGEPEKPLEVFFVMTKRATVQGYYTSEIGIHRELRYKGNQFLKEFVGCATEDGKDCPHCGQRAAGSSANRGR